MKVTENDGRLMIELAGRIDSNNAAGMEKEIFDILSSGRERNILFDAENLEYISSAGLRGLMSGNGTREQNYQKRILHAVCGIPLFRIDAYAWESG